MSEEEIEISQQFIIPSPSEPKEVIISDRGQARHARNHTVTINQTGEHNLHVLQIKFSPF